MLHSHGSRIGEQLRYGVLNFNRSGVMYTQFMRLMNSHHYEVANMLFIVREIPWSQSFSFFLIQNNIFRAAKRKKTFEATVTWRYIPKN